MWVDTINKPWYKTRIFLDINNWNVQHNWRPMALWISLPIGSHQKGWFCSVAVNGKLNNTTAVASRFGSPCCPMVVIKSPFRWGLWHLLFVQVLYSNISITDCPSRYQEGGHHLQLPKCVSHSCGSHSGIYTWSQIESHHRSHDDQQSRVLYFCPGLWGGTLGHISFGRGGHYPNLLVFTWWHHSTEDGSLGSLISP